MLKKKDKKSYFSKKKRYIIYVVQIVGTLYKNSLIV